VLQWPRPAFCRGFAEQWQIAVRTRAEIRGGCDIRFSASQDIDAYTRTIEATPAASSAIAIAAPNHPKLVRLFEEISSGEMPVFTMLNDLTRLCCTKDLLSGLPLSPDGFIPRPL
jgi:hypothetical protein